MEINGATQIKDGTITPQKLSGAALIASKLVFGERQVGNGSESLYALQGGTNVVSDNGRKLEVFLNGVLQDPGEDNDGDYSYSAESHEVTFAVAPANGSIILFNYVHETVTP